MTQLATADRPATFFEALQTQRWDDHRFYHHSRLNQSLHFVSALSFLAAYVFLAFGHVVTAAALGWGVSMLTRQSGHFFFEPKGYDEVNQATHAHKEEIKVGYNLARKYVLMTAWALTTLIPYFSPTLFGLFETPATASTYDYCHHVAWLWILTGAVAIVLRTTYLCVTVELRHGIVWATKILTDPFHDVKIYWKSPLKLLQGEKLDPMTDWPEPMRRA